jgi:hypothetical protein
MTEPDQNQVPLHECDDQLAAICRQLYDANLAPRFQVLITQGFVELLVNAVIDAKCKNAKKITGNSRDFPYSIKLLLLHELGLISDSSYKSIDKLRKYRNKAAHEPFFELSTFVTANDGGRPRRLHEVCVSLICDFFNQHSGILAPVFAPHIAASGGGIIVFPTEYRVEVADLPKGVTMPQPVKFVGGPVAGANFDGPDLESIGIPLDENLQYISAGEPFAQAGYRRQVIDGAVRYCFLTIRRPNDQPFLVEFVGGPADGIVPLSGPIQYGPEEFPVPLSGEMKPLKNGSQPTAVAIYGRRQEDGKWRYHFLRTETSGPLLDEAKAETGRRLLTQSVNAFYRSPNYSIYTVQPTDKHPQVQIQVGHRAAGVDERLGPLIQEVWRLDLDTLGSCQEAKAGQAWIGFPIAEHGDTFHRVLTQAAIPSTTERRIGHIAHSDRPDEKIEYEQVNVFFASADIERITNHVRGVESIHRI